MSSSFNTRLTLGSNSAKTSLATPVGAKPGLPQPKATPPLSARLSFGTNGQTSSVTTTATRSKSPGRAFQSTTPTYTPPPQAEVEKVTAWQTEIDSLEQSQLQIQADQMNLLHSQIHILTRELGDLQKQFVSLTQKVNDDKAEIQTQIVGMKEEMDAAYGEAHAALRIELAEHGNNAEEMRKAWEEAHGALSKAMDEGLGNSAQQMADELAAHADAHSKNLAEMEANLRGHINGIDDKHGKNIDALDASHSAKHGEHSANWEEMQNSLENSHTTLQNELAELRSGHSANLKQILADVTQQVDNLTINMEKEGELRSDVEKKLDACFGQLTQVMGISFAA